MFLDWLLDTLEKRDVDVLVIAGDVFDSMHPSAEAQALYYRFLSRIDKAGVGSVVVVGGNHDSASRLDAPRALLEAVHVHVTGGVPATDDRLDRMIAPLRVRGCEEPAAVCLAVPYVHEYRLGVRTSDLDIARTRAAFESAFTELYRTLTDRAIERFGDLPIIATGHLTMGPGARSEDYPQKIHQVDRIDGLPADILDPRIRYTALGHIHRCYPIAGSTAWYCGTPIAYALAEMKSARQVLLVDLDGEAEAKVERVEVPRTRDLLQLIGKPDEVLSALTELSWSTPLPPLVHIRVETKMAEPGLVRRLHEAVAGHEQGRPVLVEVQQRARESVSAGAGPVVRSLEELTPRDVFGLMCDAKKLDGEDRQQLEAAFSEVASASPETLDKMLADIELPPTAQTDAS